MFVRYPVEVVPWIGVDTTVVVGAEETYLVRLWFAVSLKDLYVHSFTGSVIVSVPSGLSQLVERTVVEECLGCPSLSTVLSSSNTLV